MKLIKKHLHHQLLNKKFSQRKTVLIIYGVNILFSLASILYSVGDKKLAIYLYVLLTILILWVILSTDILTDTAKIHLPAVSFKKKNKKTKNKKTSK